MKALQTSQYPTLSMHVILLSMLCIFLLSGCALIDGLTGSPRGSSDNDTGTNNPDANISDAGTNIPDNPDANLSDSNTENPDTNNDIPPDLPDPALCPSGFSCGNSGICTQENVCLYPTQFSAGATKICAIYKQEIDHEYGAIGCWSTTLAQKTRKIVEINNKGDDYTFRVKTISTGTSNTCAIIKPDTESPDQIYCWENKIELTGPTSVRVSFDEQTLGPNLDGIIVGNQHACIWSDENSIYCWGSNNIRQFGINDDIRTFKSDTPDRPVIFGSSPLFGPFHAITTKHDHTCAIDIDNKDMRCWGKNDAGQLGYGSSTTSAQSNPSSAMQVSLRSLKNPDSYYFKSVATGPLHTCAVINTEQDQNIGNVYCWGSGSDSRLGNAVATNRSQPDTPVKKADNALLQATALALGNTFSCALTPDSKTIMCWGGGYNKFTPKSVPAINRNGSQNITQIDTTPTQICALMIDTNNDIKSTKIQCTTP